MWDLAVLETCGAKSPCGGYDSFEEAVAAAKGFAAHVHTNDEGVAVFLASDDEGSGHYEHEIEVYPDGTAIHVERGSIVGTV